MLWTLLVSIGSLSFFSGALFGARFNHGYVLGTVIGLALCVPNYVIWTRLANAVLARIGNLSESAQEKRLLPLYLMAAAWCPGAAAVGYWLTGRLSALLWM